MTDLAGFALVDRLDIGNEKDEEIHQYKNQDPIFLGTRDFNLGPQKGTYTDEGKATRTLESFRLRVIPQQDHLLVKAFDATMKGQKIRISIDNEFIGEWTLPDGDPSQYGEASFLIKGSVIGSRALIDVKLEPVPGSPDTSSYIFWLFGKPDRRLEAPVGTDVAGLELTDQIDVGGSEDEAAHQYAIDQETASGLRELWWPSSGLPFLETVRANKSSESFQMKVKPGKDHVLVKGFDNLSKDQVVRVLIDGNLVGNWAIPDATVRYGESAFRIPSTFIGTKNTVDVRVEFVSSGSDVNSLHYWLFADPAKRKT